MAGACGLRQRPRPGHRGRLPAVRPQGVGPCKATPLAREVPLEGNNAASCAGQWRRCSEGKGRGLGYPFEKRMIIPL
ncbi:hypothetical protein GW17_00044774 [Ensete ventricosum]|nr:hypothetical protein GW17_00044774 [Ensete ventricosum]